LPDLRPWKRRLALGIAVPAALAVPAAVAASAGASASTTTTTPATTTTTTPATSSVPPTVTPDHRCYLVGTPVQLHGAGFAPSRTYVVSIDEVYFGQDQTDASGDFETSLKPGGLGAGVAQSIEQLQASDGTSVATTIFTVTRATGARLIFKPGSAKAPLEVWGFSLSGARLPLYVHYVSPHGALKRTVAAGHTGGQCGYLRTQPRAIFPFRASAGRWTLQVDTQKTYAKRPAAPVARIRVRIS
jgi:hypothetical protein